MSFAFFLDGVVAILLVITIVYAVILSRKLRTLRDMQNEFSYVVESFNAAAAAAEATLGEVKAVARSGAGNMNRQQLNQQIQKGIGLVDDLNILIQKGEALADQLSEDVSAARSLGRATVASRNVPATKAGTTQNESAVEKAPRSLSERELLQAMRVAR